MRRAPILTAARMLSSSASQRLNLRSFAPRAGDTLRIRFCAQINESAASRYGSRRASAIQSKQPS
jgi:hypothetical protein